MTSENYFRVGAIIGSIVALITFIGSWWYCAANYGFLLGFGLGWLPAAIAAAIAGSLSALLWGPVFLLVGFGVLLLIYDSTKEPDRPSEMAGVTDPYDSFSDRCIERKDVNGVVTSLLCGNVVLPVGATVIVPGPIGAATPPAVAPETRSHPSAALSVEDYSDEELMAIAGPPDALEGQTATNWRTGERVVLRNGKWVRTTPRPPCGDGSASCEPWERDWPAGEIAAPSAN